ncbi:lysophospholipid acyltransferase family protein [Flagellimonas allohymeniacidonis]|uniref:Lipid A biosynthesis acyltransferase n=1 Tax=Flagellimonas allohymeniacidonis TaxID=2517819 RepID=A0A4Q8QGN9_9FLAO|nr:lysophospholipid acyltransferase family protein [Allomuricauda hymeniacidonis]TAI48907.1 lipid A biosynthesis acyltransferase [Allomuricauda hymeniacidonis]
MQLLVYLIAYPLLWLVSRLPFKIIYLISDGVYFLLYHVVGYRKKVVRQNLELVFPEKSMEERLQIEKKFYAHMCDMFLEMIKTMGISNKQLQKRFVFTQLEVLHQLEAKNKSVMLMFPHYGSWEWVIALDAHIQSKGYAIYQKIGNKYFDKLVRDIRQKFGTTLITTKDTKDIVSSNKMNGQLSMYGILSDQSPMVKKALLWAPFMGITVPVHTGAEFLCRKLDLPAVYLKVTKLKRGHYQGSFHLLTDNPREQSEFELTKAFLKNVESSIREAPEYYFWTHKRWKHRDKVPEAFKHVQNSQTKP